MNWTAGDLVGVANLACDGIHDDETAEDFCRRFLRLEIADGLVRAISEDQTP